MQNLFNINDRNILVCGIKLVGAEIAEGCLTKSYGNLPVEISFTNKNGNISVTNVEALINEEWQSLSRYSVDYEELAECIEMRLASQSEWYYF